MSSTIQKKTYKITITQDKTDGIFIGRCDELHANSQGETFGKIVENMKEAVELAAQECGKPIDFNLLIIQNNNEQNS